METMEDKDSELNKLREEIDLQIDLNEEKEDELKKKTETITKF